MPKIGVPTRPSATKNRPAAVDHYVSGFCQNPPGSDEHDHCPGLFGSSVRVTCACSCHVERPRCHVCLGTENVDPKTAQCANKDDCLDALEARHQADPVHQQLTEVKRQAKDSRAEARTREATERVLARSAEAKPKAETRPVKTPRVKREPLSQQCHCGCWSMTKGGIFLPGHDAKLKGVLRRDRGWEFGDFSAVAELIARGWDQGKYYPNLRQCIDEYFAQAGGADQVIVKAVTGRYAEGR